ncbi:hypothetical protein CIPAW_08G107300 [Carya illinoinensis]|uniref:Uncharacterized protein n=1 Tax=Carya illinoinensis TaxID=32201 RepID=A0A8T1PV59_CARIL|nr:hypothetical protein CIPAW_08G107300 [Carya illinoinensis]
MQMAIITIHKQLMSTIQETTISITRQDDVINIDINAKQDTNIRYIRILMQQKINQANMDSMLFSIQPIRPRTACSSSDRGSLLEKYAEINNSIHSQH